MSQGDSSQPLSRLHRLDELCDRFEQASRAAESPRIEEFLDQVAYAERGELLQELLSLEIHYRRQRGERPAGEEYAARFPQADRAVIDAACAKPQPFQRDALAPEQDLSGDSSVSDKPEGLDPTAAKIAAPAPSHGAGVGDIVAGRYKLIEKIGEGGMGAVYMAQQTEPIKRFVALKIIKPGMDSGAVLARFEAERQALALMDHVNIARVIDAGCTELGRPFFVMELVKGTPITQCCDQRRLTPRQRLELFLPVCQAIQHAHQKGIIHRDIKPSNVLVALYDDRPVPKVIDFGLAKAVGQTRTEKTLVTAFGTVVGTARYMSPEQASLNNLDIDTRSDIYSLGVLLYELLTGSTPVDEDKLGAGAFLEILRIVREVEPPRPSARLSSSATLASVAACRSIEPSRLTSLVRGELDWIVLKALEKDRSRRYETANGLARDLQRYLADEVVEARPPSFVYRLQKLVRRHKLQAIAVALVLSSLLAGVIGTSYGLFRAKAGEKLAEDRLTQVAAEKKKAEEEKKKAEEEKRVAQAVQWFLQNKLLRQADVEWQADSLVNAGRSAGEASENLTVRELLDRAAVELAPEIINVNFPNQPRVQAAILRTVGDAYGGVGEYELAIAFLNRALAVDRENLGSEHPDTLTTMNNLAVAYKDAGKLNLALSLLEETVKLSKAKLGHDHPDTLATMYNLGSTGTRMRGGLKNADMLILIGVTSNNLQERKQHVHELTVPCLWGARL